MFRKKKTLTRKKKITFSERLKSIFFSSQGLPIVLTATVIAVLFVLFRMKGVELDYKFVEMKRKIEHSQFAGKELSAKKAKMLSIKNLRALAKKHSFNQPRENQVMVIP